MWPCGDGVAFIITTEPVTFNSFIHWAQRPKHRYKIEDKRQT